MSKIQYILSQKQNYVLYLIKPLYLERGRKITGMEETGIFNLTIPSLFLTEKINFSLKSVQYQIILSEKLPLKISTRNNEWKYILIYKDI